MNMQRWKKEAKVGLKRMKSPINMKKFLYIILCLCALLSACSEGGVEYPAGFALADSLADYNEPYKALELLDSLIADESQWSEPVRMRYALLKYKAADKAYIPITSDSTILPILQYYERTQEEWLPEAYYYAGRTYTELGDAPRALDYFQQAATLMEGSPRRAATLSRAYAQMTDIFGKRWMSEESVKYYKLSAALSEQIGDSSSLVSTYSNIAGEYRYDNWDSVAYYNEKATLIAEACHDTVWYYQLLKEKAGTCVTLGKFDEAKGYLNECFEHPNFSGFDGCWSIAARLYDSLGRADSLEYCLKKAYDQGNIYAKKTSAKRLSSLYSYQNRSIDAQYYLTKCLASFDSIEMMNDAQALQIMESSYNYNIYVRENEKLYQKAIDERSQKQRTQLVLLIVFLAGGAVLFYLFRVH